MCPPIGWAANGTSLEAEQRGKRVPFVAITAMPFVPHRYHAKEPRNEPLFHRDHEWVDVDGEIGTVGITDYAQSQLGDIVFVEVPEEGKQLNKGDDAAWSRSVKAASDVYSPVSGTVLEGNGDLADDPSLVNGSRRRWLVLQADAVRHVRARRPDGRSRLRGIRRQALNRSPPACGRG
jgi:glycine cleavage system H protein